jgi:hypothetical protein
MMIYVVSKMTDRKDEQSSETISAHVDQFTADTAAQAISHQGHDGIYGVVESVELDLTGSTSDEALAIAQAAGFELVV